MIPELISLIEESTDFETLENQLLKKKYIQAPYQNRKSLVNSVKIVYSAYGHHSDSSHFLEPLPGKIVRTSKTIYYVQGIVHEGLFHSLNEEYKESVRKVTRGWDLLCEDGFKDDFFPDANIFGELKTFGIGRLRNIIAGLPFLAKQLLLALFAKLKFVSPPEVDLKTIKTIDDLRSARLALFRRYLPEPLGMSALSYTNPNSLRLRRYVYEAEEAIRYAAEKRLNELHLIVGCAHELPLEFLLNNPDMIQYFKRKNKNNQ